MRKLLLATTALAGVALIAGGASANDQDKLNVTLGGEVEFQAGFTDSDNKKIFDANSVTADERDRDFQTKVTVNVDASGKSDALGGVEYGGRVQLWNWADYRDGYTGGTNSIRTNEAYVYLQGGWGHVRLGDTYGASDMFIFAPVVGAGQIDGAYTDFLSPFTTQTLFAQYVDDDETSTKIYYKTPSFNGFQLGASYAANLYDSGQNVVKFDQASTTPVTALNLATVVPNDSTLANYQNFVEVTGAYTGAYDSINVGLSGTLATADGNPNNTSAFRDFTAWGVGGQVGYAGFTVGGSYYDAGRFNTVSGQNKDQISYTVGVTYEVDNIEAGFSYLGGEGYSTSSLLTDTTSGVSTNNAAYIKDYTAYGFGAGYTWFPGMKTQVDAVFYDQEHQTRTAFDNEGQVVILSQKFTF